MLLLLMRLWRLDLVEGSAAVAKATAIVAAAMDMEEVGVVTLPGKQIEEKRLLLRSSQEILMEVDQCKSGDMLMTLIAYVCVHVHVYMIRY